MRRFSICVLLSLAWSWPAAAAERRYSVTDFDRVVVEGPYVVRLTVGSSTTAVATGTQAALERVTIDVSGQTLRIRRNRNNWAGSSGAQAGPLTIDLTTRTLQSARVVGPGSLEVARVEGLRVVLTVEGSGRLQATDVEADNLSLGLAGSGTLEVGGTADELTADVQGTGDLNASALRATSAAITTTTTGTVSVEVTRTARITALGLGTVEILGRPDCTVRGANADLVRCGASRLDRR
ncbi:MAG: GIN domain-containing protein [Allosphingosinicella sp.]